jgi:hypothetical protein
VAHLPLGSIATQSESEAGSYMAGIGEGRGGRYTSLSIPLGPRTTRIVSSKEGGREGRRERSSRKEKEERRGIQKSRTEKGEALLGREETSPHLGSSNQGRRYWQRISLPPL